jgi:hypothetical protein
MRLAPRLCSAALPLLLAACAEGGAAPTLPIDEARAFFQVGGIANVIVIDAVDRQALRRAVLVAPDGSLTPASSLVASPASSVASGAYLSLNPYTSGLPGAAAPGWTEPLSGQATAALHSETTLQAIVSHAEIAVPDPVAYGRDWRRYRIRLRFGDPPGGVDRRELPAPAPLKG